MDFQTIRACGLTKLAPFLGLSLAIVSCLMAGSASLVIRVRPQTNPLVINLLLFSFMTCTSLSICVIKRHPLQCEKNEWGWLFQRLFVAAVANFSVVAALQYIPASDMTAIVFCSPVVMTFISPILTAERFRFRNILLALIAVAGVFFICRPPFLFGEPRSEDDEPSHSPENRIKGIVWSIVGCFSQTYLSLIASKMRETPVHVAMLAVGFVLSIVLAVTVYSLPEVTWPSCGFDSYVAMASAILILSSITLENFSIRHEKLTTLSISLTVQLIFIMAFEVYFFQEILHWTDFLGAVLILISIFTLFFLKVKEEENDSIEKTKKQNCLKINLQKQHAVSKAENGQLLETSL